MTLMLPAFNKNRVGKFSMSEFHSVILQCLVFAGLFALVLLTHYFVICQKSGSAVTGMKYAGIGTCY